MLDALAAIVKALAYAGVLTATGGVYARASVWLSADAGDLPRRLTRNGALVLVAAALTASLLLTFRLGGQFDEPTLTAVFVSGTGAVTMLQVFGALLLLAPTGDHEPISPVLLSYAVVLTASLAFHGHAATSGVPTAVLAFVHVAAAGWWVGSLWLLRAACLHLDMVTTAMVVQRFSRLALQGVGALVVAGLAILAALVVFPDVPWWTPYTQIIALKLVLVGVVLGLATYNRRRLTPRLLAGDVTASSELRRMIDRELALIAAILVVTAVLTTYTWPEPQGTDLFSRMRK